MESSPVLKSQREILISLADPSKCNPSVLAPLLHNTHPDTVTCPTFESLTWYAGVFTTTTFSMVMPSKFIRLMPQYHTRPVTPCRAPLVEFPLNPFPWFPFTVKLLSVTLLPRAGTGGPGSNGIAASGGPLWMPSLLVPDFTKKPVPQPSPAIPQCPPAGRNKPEIRALPSMMSVIGWSAVAPANAALMRGPSSVAGPPV